MIEPRHVHNIKPQKSYMLKISALISKIAVITCLSAASNFTFAMDKFTPGGETQSLITKDLKNRVYIKILESKDPTTIKDHIEKSIPPINIGYKHLSLEEFTNIAKNTLPPSSYEPAKSDPTQDDKQGDKLYTGLTDGIYLLGDGVCIEIFNNEFRLLKFTESGSDSLTQYLKENKPLTIHRLDKIFKECQHVKEAETQILQAKAWYYLIETQLEQQFYFLENKTQDTLKTWNDMLISIKVATTGDKQYYNKTYIGTDLLQSKKFTEQQISYVVEILNPMVATHVKSLNDIMTKFKTE